MPSTKGNTTLFYASLFVILVGLAAVLFLRSSAFVIKDIKVEGLNIIQPAEIERLAAGAKGQNLILFDQDSLSRRITLHPLVNEVSFVRDFPRTLVIKVSERTPSALVLVGKGAVEVDGQGVFLRRIESWPQVDYPVITGVTLSDASGPGHKIDDPLLAAALNLLGQAPAALLPLIGEVHVNSIQQLTLFLTSGVEVRLGQATDWKDKLGALYTLLNDKDYRSIEHGVRYIDFTAAKPVIGR
ncbi:MAG: cell division protein FtsQ/DivIB [Desulfitobacteriaceae bacterium]